jgi:MFS family permease
VTRFRRVAGTTFKSMKTRNYRLWFTGQIISVSGTWVQTVAQAWLVLRLAPRADQGIDLGFTLALQFVPMLLLGAWGGLIADRFDKRRILVGTQTAGGVLALVLAFLTATGTVRLWQVFLLALLLGFVNLVDNPARQSFVVEMVGSKNLSNAVSLNSIVMNGARVVGPAIGGLLIATLGLTVCFEVNAASYLAVIAALLLMRKGELHQRVRTPKAKGQLREGLRYAWETRDLRDVLLVVLVVGLLSYNFTVILPLLAKLSFHGGAGIYSLLTSLMAAGAVIGGLIVAGRGRRPNVTRLGMIGVGFGIFILALALAPNLIVACIVIIPMGGLSIAFIATANSTIQLRVDDAMRGRVMALYAIGFLGTTPLGAPLVGWISQAASPRVALSVGAAAAIIASAVLLVQRRPDRAGNRPPAAFPVGKARPRDRTCGDGSRLTPGQGFGSFGSPSTRSPTMLRWISAVPPQMVSDTEKK